MAGTHSGAKSNDLSALTATPAITANSAYSAGEVVGGLIALANAARSGIFSGTITKVRVEDLDGQDANCDVVFFAAEPVNSTLNDHAAAAVAAADAPSVIGVAHVTDWTALGASKPGHGQAANLGLTFNLAGSGTTLYAAIVTRGTPTWTGESNVILTVDIAQD